MDSPAPAETVGQAQAAIFLDDFSANKTAALPSDKSPHLLVLSDSKQQPGQLNSPTSILSPRCSACSSAPASAVGSPHTSVRSSLKGASAAVHSKPPWNIGTKAAGVTKVYVDAANSPTSSPRATKNPSSPRLRLATCTSTAEAPSSSATPTSLHCGAISSERAAKAECSPSDNQVAKVDAFVVASFGPDSSSIPPHRHVTTPPPTSPMRPPHRLITSITAAGSAVGQGAATALPGNTPAAPVAGPRAVAGLIRKPGAVVTVTNGQSVADNQLSAPGTAASTSTASRPATPTSNGNHSTASSIATSSKELGSMHGQPSARSQSARSLNSSSSPHSPNRLQQQLASSKGSSLKGIQANQAAAGATKASAVQKPRRSAVEAMLKKQFSTTQDFELKVQQWRGKEKSAGPTQAIATADSAGSDEPAYSLAELKQEGSDTDVDLDSQLSAEQVVEPIAAMASAGAVDVPVENPSNMVPHTAEGRSAGGATPFAVVGLETAGSTDADACCYFSTPRRGERDLFKRQRASIVGETDCTVKPAGGGVAAKQEQEQLQVLVTATITEQQPVQHQEVELLLPVPVYPRTQDKSPADGNRNSRRYQSKQQGWQQHTDSNQQVLLQQQDSAAEVEELQQAMQQRMPSLPLEQPHAGLQSPLRLNAVQQVQQQRLQQEVYEALSDEPLLDPIQQRWPSLPVLQEQQRQSSLLLTLPCSLAGGIDLGMAVLQGSANELPTPHLPVVQPDLAGKDATATGTCCLKASKDGWQPSSISGASDDSSAVILSFTGESPGSIIAPNAGGPGTAAAGQQEGQQHQHRSLQYSTSGCVRISTDADARTNSNVPVSDDFTAAVSSFSGRYSPGLFGSSGPCAAATVLPCTMPTAADPAAALTIAKQQHGCTAVAATNSSSSGACNSASTNLFDAAALQSSQQQKQQGLALTDCQPSYDSTTAIKTRSSPIVEEAVVCRPSRRVSRHSRQVSMDGSAVSGSEAASLAAIAAELEEIRRSSHDSRMVGAKPAAEAVTDAADTDAEVAADTSSVAADAMSAAVERAWTTSEAASAVLSVELSQAGRQSRRVSQHSRQVSMDGCSNVSWLSQLHSEMAQAAVPGTPVDSHLLARAPAADYIKSKTPEQPCDSATAHENTTANAHAAVEDGVSKPTQATATPTTTRQALELPSPDSELRTVQNPLQLLQQQQGHNSEVTASSDNTISPTDSIAYCADSPGSLSNCSSASGLTQSNRSVAYQNSVEGDSAEQDMKVTWNQMYDLSLADGYRDSDAAVTRTSSLAAEYELPAADSPAAATLSVATAIGSAEHVLEVTADLVTQPVDSLYPEDSLPLLEAANSLVCMGSGVYCQDPEKLDQEASAPAVNGNHITPAAEGDVDAAAAPRDTRGSQPEIAKTGRTIALLFEMKHLLQEDVAALRASLDSLGQPSPRVQQQQQQNQQLPLVTDGQQQNPVSVTAATVAAATTRGEGSGATIEGQLPSLALAPLPRMQVPPSPSSAGIGSPSISAHALPVSPVPCIGQTLSSRILQQLYPAGPFDGGASSSRSLPALAMSNACMTAVGSGRIPNQWGFAAAQLVNALTSTTNRGDTTVVPAAGRSKLRDLSGLALLAPQAAAAPVAAPPPNSTPVLTGVHRMVHRTLTSRVRSLLGGAAAAADAGCSGARAQGAPCPGGLTPVSALQPGVAAMHVDASGLLQVVLQVQLPAGSLPLAGSAGQ